MQQRPPVLDNPKSERIRRVAALGGRSFRQKADRILVEGPQAVTELLRNQPDAVVDVYVAEQWEETDLYRLAANTTKWVHSVSERVSAAISSNSQGIAAVAETKAILSAPTETPAESAGLRYAVALPETQDPGNLGTMIRSAAAFGADAVFLGKGSADATNPKVIRASAGAVFLIPIHQADLAQAAELYRQGTARILGAAGEGGAANLDRLVATALEEGNADSPLGQNHLWVFGNEARGLSDADISLCDMLVRIPIGAKVESLNAAAAAAVCLHSSSLIAAQRRAKHV